MKNGFTLVELSIVLVIIGLLIGGILVAQSLIDSAKINAQVRQIQQYDIAVSNFKERYRGLPGDSTKFYAGGNDDGFIFGAGGDWNFREEILRYWKNLSQGSGIKTEKGVEYDINGGVMSYEISIPQAKINNDSGIMVSTVAPILDAKPKTVHVGKNVYTITKWQGGGSNLHIDSDLTTSIPPTDALAVDKKMDDGIANSGDVQAAIGGTTRQGGIAPGDTPKTTCAIGAEYQAATSTADCGLSIILMSQTGESY